MKNYISIVLITLIFGASCVHAQVKSKLSNKQQKEFREAIMGYRDSLSAMQLLQEKGKKPSSADIKRRDAQKKIVDDYNKKYGQDPFVVEKMQNLDKFLKKTRPTLPEKGQDYYGKLPAPALPAKDQDYYGKLTPPALPEKGQDYYGKLPAPALPPRNAQYNQFMRSYKGEIILPHHEINRDWLAQASAAIRNDLGGMASRETVKETLWREIEGIVDQYANSPMNVNNPLYKEYIKASFDKAFVDFWNK